MTRKIKQQDSPQGSTRREFIKTAAIMAGAAGALGVSGQRVLGATDDLSVSGQGTLPTGESKGLSITMAGYKFTRVEALVDGHVKIEGCDAQFEIAKIGNMNTHVFSGPQTRDVTEIGLHPFMLAYANDSFRDYTLLPIFPLRLFRHKSIFIRTDRGINKPQDLRGKTIGTAGYSSTSLIWIRGMLQEEYGIKPEDVQWIIAKKDSSANAAGKVSKQESQLPKGVPISEGPLGKDESDLLESGEVDALLHAVEPRAYIEGHPKVKRLFPDYRSAERAYFAKTGIFPIMHAVAIKREVLKQSPWLAEALFNAYSQAKQLSYDYMAKLAWIFDSLPWYGQEFEETRALMGDNYYSYGIEPNRKILEALFRYSHQQGLASRKLTIEELFDPSTLELNER